MTVSCVICGCDGISSRAEVQSLGLSENSMFRVKEPYVTHKLLLPASDLNSGWPELCIHLEMRAKSCKSVKKFTTVLKLWDLKGLEQLLRDLGDVLVLLISRLKLITKALSVP